MPFADRNPQDANCELSGEGSSEENYGGEVSVVVPEPISGVTEDNSRSTKEDNAGGAVLYWGESDEVESIHSDDQYDSDDPIEYIDGKAPQSPEPSGESLASESDSERAERRRLLRVARVAGRKRRRTAMIVASSSDEEEDRGPVVKRRRRMRNVRLRSGMVVVSSDECDVSRVEMERISGADGRSDGEKEYVPGEEEESSTTSYNSDEAWAAEREEWAAVPLKDRRVVRSDVEYETEPDRDFEAGSSGKESSSSPEAPEIEEEDLEAISEARIVTGKRKRKPRYNLKDYLGKF